MDAQKKILALLLIALLLALAALPIDRWRGAGGKEPWQRTQAYHVLSPEERQRCDQAFREMFEYYEKAHAVNPSQAKRAFPDQEYENWIPRLCTATAAPSPASPPAEPPLLVPLPTEDLPEPPAPSQER